MSYSYLYDDDENSNLQGIHQPYIGLLSPDNKHATFYQDFTPDDLGSATTAPCHTERYFPDRGAELTLWQGPGKTGHSKKFKCTDSDGELGIGTLKAMDGTELCWDEDADNCIGIVPIDSSKEDYELYMRSGGGDIACLDKASQKTCNGHGTCVNELTCACDEGWKGTTCEVGTLNKCTDYQAISLATRGSCVAKGEGRPGSQCLVGSDTCGEGIPDLPCQGYYKAKVDDPFPDPTGAGAGSGCSCTCSPQFPYMYSCRGNTWYCGSTSYPRYKCENNTQCLSGYCDTDLKYPGLSGRKACRPGPLSTISTVEKTHGQCDGVFGNGDWLTKDECAVVASLDELPFAMSDPATTPEERASKPKGCYKYCGGKCPEPHVMTYFWNDFATGDCTEKKRCFCALETVR